MEQITKKLLIENNHFQWEAVIDYFKSHPDYPSLFAVSDSLAAHNIKNAALKVPKDKLDQLPKTFLAVCIDKVMLVTKDDDKIKCSIGKKESVMSKDEFLQRWDGVILVIEPNGKRSSNFFFSPKYFLLVPIILAYILQSAHFGWSAYSLLSFIISVFGVAAAVVISMEQLGIKNEVVSQICNVAEYTSCDTVLSSQKSSLNTMVNLGDLPIYFFGTALLSLLVSPDKSANAIGVIAVVSLIPVLYSFYLQIWKIRKLCVLCLIVAVLVILQASAYLALRSSVQIQDFYILFAVASILVPIWLMAKKFLFQAVEDKKSVSKLLRFKRNSKLFQFLYSQKDEIQQMKSMGQIMIGSTESPLIFTLVISPTCSHCHTAVIEALKLQKEISSSVSVQIIFNLNPENLDNRYKAVALNLLTINHSNPEEIEQALLDWHLERFSLDQWTAKWGQREIPLVIYEYFQRQYEWCRNAGFTYTPVKIVNGRLLPAEYAIDELRFFIDSIAAVSHGESVFSS